MAGVEFIGLPVDDEYLYLASLKRYVLYDPPMGPSGLSALGPRPHGGSVTGDRTWGAGGSVGEPYKNERNSGTLSALSGSIPVSINLMA